MSTTLCLGPEGTHSHEAARVLLGKETPLTLVRTFQEIFQRLEDDPAAVALVPFENSIEGSVTPILDLLVRHPTIRIARSLAFQVRQNLIVSNDAMPLTAIQKVYSHPQALAQCANFLRTNLPAAEWVETPSTAAAVAQIAAETNVAAIGSLAAAELAGLTVSKRNIQDNHENITRFLLIGQQATAAPTASKALFHIQLPNEPGALLRVLQPFDTVGVNLTSIQSRPVPGQAFEYGFFVEADITVELQELMLNLLNRFANARVLGRY